MQPNTPSDQAPQQSAAVQTNQNLQNTATPPQPAPKSKKTLIIWLTVIGVVLLAVIAAVIVYATMFNISKDDYKRALDTAKSIDEKAEAINNASTADLNSDDNQKIAEAVPKLKQSIEDVRTTMNTFRKEKALNDKDVRAKSDPYLIKLDKALVYLGDYATDIGDFRAIINDCSAALETQSTAESQAALAQSLNKMGNDLTACTNKLKDAEKKMKSDDGRALARAFIGPYEVMAEQSKKAAQAASAGNLAAYTEASNTMDQAFKDMSDNSAKVIEDTTAHVKELDSTKEYEALVATLELKAK